MIIITATAPTSYQYSSLKNFGMPIQKNGNGSFTSSREFDSMQDAKDYLTQRAEIYYEEDKELVDALADIEYGALTLDAVTAYIKEKS